MLVLHLNEILEFPLLSCLNAATVLCDAASSALLFSAFTISALSFRLVGIEQAQRNPLRNDAQWLKKTDSSEIGKLSDLNKGHSRKGLTEILFNGDTFSV